VAAYALSRNADGVFVPRHVNSVAIASRSGYVCVSDRTGTVYSAGGATGDVVTIRAEDGGLRENVQTVSYVGEQGQRDDGSTMDFGGLRHGAHGCDLSPDGRVLFVPDMCAGPSSLRPEQTLRSGLQREELRLVHGSRRRDR
jgi:carboxy-cis,cis-muconate cyclase